jgi:hypothetical protein
MLLNLPLMVKFMEWMSRSEWLVAHGVYCLHPMTALEFGVYREP